MLSLVIPTYRERDNIEPLLTRLGTVAPSLGEPIEVLIVDNASDDGTADRARSLLGQVVPGRVVEPALRCGLAEAVLLGIREASGDLIGVMDADLSHPPELLPRLVEAVRAGRQMAVASRYTPGGGVEGWPRLRRMLSRLGNLAARPLTTVADTTAGYFVIRAELLRRLSLKAQGFKILLEILVQGCLHDVEEVPYVFRDRVRGESKLSGQVLGSYTAQLARLYAHRLRHACPHERTAGMQCPHG